MRTGFFDVHCHILPGVDDGSKTPEETKKLLEMEYQQGVRNLILTPHLRRAMFETPADAVWEAFEQTKEIARGVGEDLQLHLGCEYHVTSEMVSVLNGDERRTMAGTRYVLTEFSGGVSVKEIRGRIHDLLQWGYRPIVAHAERCACLLAEPENVEDLIRMGAFIQVNAASILGDEGRPVRGFCKKLIRQDLVHLIGSDAHDTTDRMPNIGPCAQYLARKFGEDTAERLLIDNPGKLISNEYM